MIYYGSTFLSPFRLSGAYCQFSQSRCPIASTGTVPLLSETNLKSDKAD